MKNITINWGDIWANPEGTRITDTLTNNYLDIDLSIFKDLPEGDQHDRLRKLTLHIADFISENRDSDKLELLLDWNIWNSGGGCLIASLDYIGGSVHLSDEALINSSVSSEAYWEIEDPDEQETTHKQNTIWLTEHGMVHGKDLKLEKYLAILVAREVNLILKHWES